MRIKRYIFCLLIILPGLIIAQVPDKTTPRPEIKLYKPDYHFYLGGNYSYFPSTGNLMSLFATHSVFIPLSKRFSAEGGIIASNSMVPVYFTGELNRTFKNYSTLAIYGSTIYQLTPNLTLYSTGTKQLFNTSGFYPLNVFPRNSFTFGTSYKIGKGFTVGTSIHISEGYGYGIPGPRNDRSILYPSFPW